MAAVVFLVCKELGSLALGKLGSMAKERVNEEFGLLVGVQDEAKELDPTLTLIKAVLQDAEVKQTNSSVVKLWLDALKEIMYDAEDVLDEWYTRVTIAQSEITDASSSAISTKVFSFLASNCSCFQPVFFFLFGDNFQPIVVRYDIAHRIKGIRARLVKHSSEINQLGLIASQSHEDNRPSQPSTGRRLTTSMVDVSKIHGRDSDKDDLVRMLLGEIGSSEQQEMVHVPVISIVGTGGFGKTALAQLIYNEDTIVAAFSVRIWVCVSDPFNLERIVKEIIQQAGGKPNDVIGLESLLQLLFASVKGKRFLLVLDDVWSEDDTEWTDLKLSLDAGAAGSRIIVTTRYVRVANIMGSADPHKLGPLSDADCWLLFRDIAFLGRSKVETEKLENIGRDLVAKCRGVPLAVKTLASTMRFKKSREEWRAVLESDFWNVQKDKEGLFPSLMFSYQALTPSLKLCFLYCAVYPKDSRMKKDELVKLWMAQGFLESDGGEEEELELIGAHNFDIFAMRSLFQDFEEAPDGSIVGCKMHDLVHDFAQSLASKECLHIDNMNTAEIISNKVRHMTGCYWGDWNSSILMPEKIRTLMLSNVTSSQRFNQFTCLRTLEIQGILILSQSGIPELLGEVGGLLHLRYLDLSWNYNLRELPETMCNLVNLQTLKLNWCRGLPKLPEGIGKLRNLRHIEIERTDKLTYFPRSIGKLSRLRTLCKFTVSGTGEGCGIGELRSLNHLRGTLQLYGLRHIGNVDDAKHAELHEKKNLSCLELIYGDKKGRLHDFPESEEFGEGEIKRMEQVLERLRRNVNLEELEIDGYPSFKLPESEEFGEGEIKRMEEVLECLRPNVNLEELEIDGYPGFKLPSWMFTDLSSVCNLTLHGCYNCRTLPGLGRLQLLETLAVRGCRFIKHIGAEFYGAGVGTSFPKLKTLEFDRMFELETWEIPFSKSEKVMPCLRDLEVKSCKMLRGLPSLGRIESLEIIKASDLPLVKVGTEFWGMSSDSSGEESTGNIISSGGGDYVKEQILVFPKLQELTFSGIKEIEWTLPTLSLDQKDRNVEIMPRLKKLHLAHLHNEKALPAFLGKLQFLERLELTDLTAVKHVSHHLLGTSDGESTTPNVNVVLFPKLTELQISNLEEWEEEEHVEEIGTHPITASVMPHLRKLEIQHCSKLKVVPHYMFSQSLRILELGGCRQLTGTQPCLPPLLEEMKFSSYLGELSTSLLPIISHNHNTTYPNLKCVEIEHSPHYSLPEGLNQLTSLQQLLIRHCDMLDLTLEELLHLPMLQKVEITRCPIITERCRREDWMSRRSILSSHHIRYKIIVLQDEDEDEDEITITLAQEDSS